MNNHKTNMNNRATPLSDLTFTEDGNPDYLNDNPNIINWYVF